MDSPGANARVFPRFDVKRFTSCDARFDLFVRTLGVGMRRPAREADASVVAYSWLGGASMKKTDSSEYAKTIAPRS